MIALQYHSPGAFEVRFKNIRIKPAGQKQAAINTECPICGKPANADHSTEYEGTAYAFHSNGCKDKWVKQRTESLYHRIGGKAAMGAAIEQFYVKVLADKHINGFFEDVDMKRQKRKQQAFLSAVFGGPTPWKGKDMRAAHKNLVDVDETHFAAVAGHLQSTLTDLKVPEELIKGLVRK
ncbi:MAG: hemoglobin [Verrucomicrobiales bacterium]